MCTSAWAVDCFQSDQLFYREGSVHVCIVTIVRT